jgi:hypothetical protein
MYMILFIYIEFIYLSNRLWLQDSTFIYLIEFISVQGGLFTISLMKIARFLVLLTFTISIANSLNSFHIH